MTLFSGVIALEIGINDCHKMYLNPGNNAANNALINYTGNTGRHI